MENQVEGNYEAIAEDAKTLRETLLLVTAGMRSLDQLSSPPTESEKEEALSDLERIEATLNLGIEAVGRIRRNLK